MKHSGAGTESAPGVTAEFVVPINLRACFLRYMESNMRLVKGAEGLTLGQRRWTARFGLMTHNGVDLDRDFWPFIGRAGILEIQAAKKNET